MFRTLRADEVDVRIQTLKDNGFSLLLFKNARVDMDILDETIGAMNWKREHTRDNANCIVSIYNSQIGQWISKEDTGVESYTEKEKGLASDSFKRACVNWGIGRELYTAPNFIWINNEGEVKKDSKGKLAVYEKFTVSHIAYDSHRNISALVIVDSKGKVRYELKGTHSTQKAEKPKATPQAVKAPKEPVKATEDSLKCSSCAVDITDKVADYSTKKYGKTLCMTCQKKEG